MTTRGHLAPQARPHPQRHRTSSLHLGRLEPRRPRLPPPKSTIAAADPFQSQPIRHSLPVNALAALEVAGGHRRHRSPPCRRSFVRSFAPSERTDARMFQVRSAHQLLLVFLRIGGSAATRSSLTPPGRPVAAFIASVETEPNRGRDRCRKKPVRFSGSGARPFGLPPEFPWHWQ